MLKCEKYIDVIASAMTNTKCKFIKEDILKVKDCNGLLSCNECREKVKRWLSEEYEPEIDWLKVPVGTPVLVRDGNVGIWGERYFALYLPEGYHKFCVIADGKNHENAENVTFWEHCKLAEEIDPTPYLKES